MPRLRSALAALRRVPNKALAARALVRSALGVRATPQLERNLQETYRWLCRAQDAVAGGGVAGWYHLLSGWSAAYPETTGYLIPTFLGYAKATGDAEARARALRMADWEIAVQLPSGAVRSGVLSGPVGPAVFNTGQVLFGWIGAYLATAEASYAEAARRAAEWLVATQDEDGAWRRDLSVVSRNRVAAYNVRAAWGLALAGRILGRDEWTRAARRNADWTLLRQLPNGWFEDNTFYEGETPALHTIAYVQEGLQGLADLLGEPRYADAVRRSLRPLLEKGGDALRARYDRNWRPPGPARCLTGEAQLALVVLRLARRDGDAALLASGRAVLARVASAQDLGSPFPESRGGLAGSQPMWADYHPLAYTNWAAKFLLDALLLALRDHDLASHELPPA